MFNLASCGHVSNDVHVIKAERRAVLGHFQRVFRSLLRAMAAQLVGRWAKRQMDNALRFVTLPMGLLALTRAVRDQFALRASLELLDNRLTFAGSFVSSNVKPNSHVKSAPSMTRAIEHSKNRFA
jgi:hypothetical protein